MLPKEAYALRHLLLSSKRDLFIFGFRSIFVTRLKRGANWSGLMHRKSPEV